MHTHPMEPVTLTQAVDPVCGMKVDPAKTPHHAEHGGATYHFCSAGCREKFVKNPEAYLQKATAPLPAMSAPPAPAPVGAVYTCPMHPEVVRDRPGSCPICGMALEPMHPVAGDHEANPELTDMTRRFWVGLVLSAPLLALAMFWPMSSRVLVWVQLVLATPVVLWGGAPFFQRGWASLVSGRLNMFTLIALGTGVAYGYSLVAALIPGMFPASFRDPHGGVPLYFEA